MGMTIDKIIKTLLWFEDYNEDKYCGGDRIQDEHGDWFYKVSEEDFEAFRQAAATMRKYQQLQADYEARLKAEKIAMLEELKTEIDNMPKYYPYTDHSRCYIDGDVFGLIQQKINALKGDK